MNRFILPSEEIPHTLYRVQRAEYHVPKGMIKKGIYALNSDPKEPLGQGSLAEEVDNHFCITQCVLTVEESQWPSPFLSVFSTREDAEAAAKKGYEKLEGAWDCIEISGAALGSRRTKILRAKDVKGELLPASDNEYLVWRFIPEETIITTRVVTVPAKVSHWMRKAANGDVELGCIEFVKVNEIVDADETDDITELMKGAGKVQRGDQVPKSSQSLSANHILGSGHMLAGSQFIGVEQTPANGQASGATLVLGNGEDSGGIQLSGSEVSGSQAASVNPATFVNQVQPSEQPQNSSQSQNTSGSQNGVPDGPRKVKKVLEHWPEKCTIENTKSYLVSWEGNFADDWVDVEDLKEDVIDAYWDLKELRRKRKRGSNTKRMANA